MQKISEFVRKYWVAGVLGRVLLPLAVLGSEPMNISVQVNNLGDLRTSIICRIVFWMVTFIIGISVVMAVYAAFLYLTSGGSEEKVGQAGKLLTYVAIGIAIAIFAKVFPVLVGDLLGIDLSQGGC